MENQSIIWNLFYVNNKTARTKSLKSFWFYVIDFEQISHIVLAFPLLTLNN